MRTGTVMRTLVVVFALAGVIIATTAARAEDPLKSGIYTAKVKALVCRGCGSLVKKTMEGLKPIETAAVDQQAGTVEFTVRKDTTIKLSEIQAALDAAAAKMGMGADYTLSNVKAKQ